MSDSIHLLTLPMEIRCHIYSFLYLEHRLVDFSRPKLYYTKTALYLACQQLYQETSKYYYSRNTFWFSAYHHFAVSEYYYFPRHFDLVKILRIESLTFFWKTSDNEDFTSTRENQQKLEKCLQGILEANPRTGAPNLNKLILVDHVPPKSAHWYWDSGVDNSEKKLEKYMQVFERLQIGVGDVVLDIKDDWTVEGHEQLRSRML